jgi:hypothetical protein
MGGIISSIGSIFGGLTGGGKNTSTASSATPQQAALAAYTKGQQNLATNAADASSGTGMSTMNTYADAAHGIGAATQLAGVADQNAAAAQAANSSLQNLASSAGFGTTSGSLGTTEGNIGSVNPNPGT